MDRLRSEVTCFPSQGAKKVKAKPWFTILAIATLAALLVAPPTGADTVKGRSVYHFVKIERVEVGDVPGHVVGVAEHRGLMSLDTGEVATHIGRLTFDYTNGSGAFHGYNLVTFEDGSTKIFEAQGKTTAQPSGVSKFEASYAYIKGTGRFEGIEGTGSFTGKRIAPLTPGASAECYLDFTETYTLPPR
jgi:hypothetical protein